jgi:hypothetical protein
LRRSKFKEKKKMKKPIRTVLTAVLLTVALLAGQNAAFAQTAKRIKFAAGKTSTVVRSAGDQSYLVGVRSGQTCRIELVSARRAATLEVLDAAGMDLTEGSDGRVFEGSFDQAGELRINVSSGGKTAFTLKITIK